MSLVRRLRSAFLLSALLCATAASAQRTPFQIRCEDGLSKTVTVLTAQQNGYSVDNSRSYYALTVMKGGARANSYVLGLTRTESRVTIALGGPVLQDSVSGYECVAPQISVKLYYTPIVIYIGREFPPGGCAYREIMAHEQRHLKAYLDHLPKVEELVRAALAKRFGDKPLYGRSGTAQAALSREIDTGWMPFVKAELKKVEAQQAAIDSPEEYARLGKSCGGEITHILAAHRRGP